MEIDSAAPEVDVSALRIGIAMSDFNEVVTDPLLQGALDALEKAGVGHVTVRRVSGALEVPVLAGALARTHHAVIAIGAVIEGETDHYLHVATQASAGVSEVAIATGVPVANAILTVREFDHARDRSLPGPSNKGYEAAEAAIRAVGALSGL